MLGRESRIEREEREMSSWMVGGRFLPANDDYDNTTHT